MDDLDKFTEEQKKRDKEFAEGFDEGYENFKFGVLLCLAREQAGFTKEDMARALSTNKSAISVVRAHDSYSVLAYKVIS